MAGVPLFTVRALFDYSSPHEDDLNFTTGQVITVTAEEDADWLHGEYHDPTGKQHQGIFPKNYTERVPDPPGPPKLPPVPIRPQQSEDTVGENTRSQADRKQDKSSSRTETAPIRASPETQESHHSVSSETPMSTKSEPTAIPVSDAILAKPAQSPITDAQRDNSFGSFRDRIAAFNKPAVAPVVPVPNQSRATGFVKKPFVPLPPSKIAFASKPQYAAESRRDTETRGLGPPTSKPSEIQHQKQDESPSEEAPKVSSLKDRIAMLQSMQLNPAAGGKVKKPPKPPPTKRKEEVVHQLETSVTDPIDPNTEAESFVGSEQVVTHTTTAAPSGDVGTTEEPGSPNFKSEVNDSGRIEGTVENLPAEPKVPLAAPNSLSDHSEAISDEDVAPDVSAEAIDPEVARRLAIRERMMKMSGGMGMHGFVAHQTYKVPKQSSIETSFDEDKDPQPPRHHEEIRMVPILPVARPGPPSPVETTRDDTGSAALDDDQKEKELERKTTDPVKHTNFLDDVKSESHGAIKDSEVQEPNSQQEYRSRLPPPPPPPPNTTEPLQRPQGTGVASEGSESDDEMSLDEMKEKTAAGHDNGPRMSSILPPASSSGFEKTNIPTPSVSDTSSSPVNAKRASYISKGGHMPPIPVSGGAGNRQSLYHLEAPATRPPPPPPPLAPPSRRATTEAPPAVVGSGAGDDYEITEYEGDIDTELDDNKEPFKDVMSSHGSAKRAETADAKEDAVLQSLESATTHPPPPPRPHGLPPPPPVAPPVMKRDSSERTRPISYSRPSYQLQGLDDDEETGEASDESPPDLVSPVVQDRSHGRYSEDAPRSSVTLNRRSVELSRITQDHPYQARDEDLGHSSMWWTQEQTPPPAFQQRQKELCYEVEDSTSTKRGGRTQITRDVYILFQDYSQTVVTAIFERDNPNHARIDQRHEPPPQPPKQDKLEAVSTSIGRQIVSGAETLLNKVVGDGLPSTLAIELVKSVPNALSPVGIRTYGVVVYQNLGNATTQQLDEIRPGDIVTFRNARFQGHKGGLHQKYTVDLSKTDHVGVVYDWDGTKRKIRLFEQGRESKKVKLESFKIGDLRSGEVKVWRVVERSWVGW